MLEGIRYFTGSTLTHLGLKEFVRRIYIKHARDFLRAHQNHLAAAWIRRSLVNSDFVPAMSDVDLTVLISLTNLKPLYAKPIRKSLFVKDIQIIAEEFLSPWIRTGGFRNRQISQWKPLMPGSRQLLDDPPVMNDEIAFELSHEAYHLYWQIDQIRGVNTLSEVELKLWREIQRLNVYWRTRNPEVFQTPRIYFEPSEQGMRTSLMGELESFAQELLQYITPPMNDFNIDPLKKTVSEYGYETFLFIRGKPVFVLTDHLAIDKVKRSFFVITEKFLKLIKGIGVQEQDLLNVAAKAPGYYREFNRQRLAHDLVQALILEPWNKSQIFYCFKNIEEFLVVLGASDSEFKKLPEDEAELLAMSHRALARLASLS